MHSPPRQDDDGDGEDEIDYGDPPEAEYVGMSHHKRTYGKHKAVWRAAERVRRRFFRIFLGGGTLQSVEIPGTRRKSSMRTLQNP